MRRSKATPAEISAVRKLMTQWETPRHPVGSRLWAPAEDIHNPTPRPRGARSRRTATWRAVGKHHQAVTVYRHRLYAATAPARRNALLGARRFRPWHTQPVDRLHPDLVPPPIIPRCGLGVLVTG